MKMATGGGPWPPLTLLYGLSVILIEVCWALKEVRITVPPVARSGDTVTLRCEYDLEEVALYSIKWYRGDEEFYRYIPKESPPFRAFPVNHVNVDLSKSGPTEVTLRGVRRELTGDYKCEVSADAPLFHTDIKTAHMIVAEVPSDNPILRTDPPSKVEIGQKVKAECYSPGSDPPANISWYINDDRILFTDRNIKPQYEIKSDPAIGLKSSKSTLEIVAVRSFFISGFMRIKCQASIFSIWERHVEVTIKEDNQLQLAPVMGPSQSHTDQVIEIIRNDARMNRIFVFYVVNTLCVILFLR